MLVSPLAMAGKIWTEKRVLVVEMGGERQHGAAIHQGPVDEHEERCIAHGSPGEMGVAELGSPTGRITRQGLP
jgi:hypothetical protein